MDIRCPQCETLYEVDDDLVRSKNATLKCRECQHIFRLGADATPSREDQQRWMVRDPRSGDVLYFDQFETLHRWIMERKVDRRWEISRTGGKWKPLGEIGEFAPVFQVVDNVALTGEAAGPGGRAATESAAGASARSARARRDTLKQFDSDEHVYREGARQARQEAGATGGDGAQRERLQSDLEAELEAERQDSGTPARQPSSGQPSSGQPSSRQATGDGGRNVRLQSDMFGSKDSREAAAQGPGRAALDSAAGGADAPEDDWSFGDEVPLEAEQYGTGEYDEPVDWNEESGGRNWGLIVGVAVVLIGGAVGYLVAFQPEFVESVRTRLAGEPVDLPPGDDDGDGEPVSKERAIAENGPPVQVAVARVSTARAAGSGKADEAGREQRRRARAEATSQTVKALVAAEEKAQEAAKKEKEKKPKLGYEGTLRAANSALQNGQSRKARNLFHRAIDMKSNSSEAITGLGWALLNLGKSDAAAAQFRRAIHINPAFGDAYIGLGSAERELGHTQKALDAYQDYLDRHPNGSSASIAEYQSEQLKSKLGLE